MKGTYHIECFQHRPYQNMAVKFRLSVISLCSALAAFLYTNLCVVHVMYSVNHSRPRGLIHTLV